MKYEPNDKTDPNAVCDAAFRCGRDLHPTDRRADWIDALPARLVVAGQDVAIPLRGDATDAYHAGQAERYECENW